MNVLVIGAGGIGSYYAEVIDKLIENNQFQKSVKFTFVDDDKVELKNIIYQNFESSDISSYKVDALEERYFNLHFEKLRVAYNDLKKYDFIIICADNNVIRRDVYKNYEINKIPFIDSRSNGKACCIYSSDTDEYLLTLSESNENFSCQFPYQLQKHEIELGNRIVAQILAQGTLTYFRKKQLPSDFIHSF